MDKEKILLSAIDKSLVDVSGKEAVDFCVWFNNNAHTLILKHGEESLDKAIGAIYGCEGFMGDVNELGKTNKAALADFYESVFTLYGKTLARFTSDHLGHLGGGSKTQRPLNGSCYRLWDMDGIECGAINKLQPHSRLSLDLLDRVIRLPSSACVESGLHGLNHLARKWQREVRSIIDGALEEGVIPESLRQYARDAREGVLQ